MLVITTAGLDATGVIDDRAEQQTKPHKAPQRGKVQRKRRSNAVQKPSVRPGTKLATMIELLHRNGGATIAEIVDATGWQQHSVRGTISGSLKKKMDLSVTSEAVEGRGRVYRIGTKS